jgi:hypothetical protein
MDPKIVAEKDKRFQRFTDGFWEDNPYALDLLKGHLLVEEVLEEIIFAACRKPESARESRMSFYTKAKLAEAIAGVDSPVWPCIESLNSARNELAHGRALEKLEAKIDAYITCTRHRYPETSWGSERGINLTWAIVSTHAAISGVAAGWKGE